MKRFDRCEHCGSPYKGNPCWWLHVVAKYGREHGKDPEQHVAEYLKMGWDWPCHCDKASAEELRRNRFEGLKMAAVVISPFAALLLIAWLAS